MSDVSDLSEYEQMRVLELFNEEEISKIEKTRQNFEHKLTQPTRGIKDYVEFIKHERVVMTTIKERLITLKVTSNHSILTQIADRMKQLYSQALSKFTQNIRFWDEYIKFLQSFKYQQDISPTFERMLQFHSDKPEVWIRAILWEQKENFDDERVKSLLMRAQQKHPECQKLYLLFFRIELENKSQLDELEAMQLADLVYSRGKNNFTNIDFFVEMLNICDKFSYASSIQRNIIDDMRQMFSQEEVLWNMLAQRELNGLSPMDCTVDFTGLIKSEDDENKSDDCKMNLKKLKIEDLSSPPHHTIRKRIETCIHIYEQAVKIVDTAKMWNFYIQAMLELNGDLTAQASMKKFCLKQAFEGAIQSNHMSEEQYLKYIELLHASNPKDPTIEDVLKKASNSCETTKIWILYLRYYMFESNFSKTQEVFRTGKDLFGSDGVEFWHTYFLYLRSCRHVEANAEYDRYIVLLSQQKYAAFNALKVQIVDLINVTKGIKRARQIYKLFIHNYPESYEVHDLMAELESKQMFRDPVSERECLESMINSFGKTRTDVWLRYMRFERYAGEPKHVANLHNRALVSLNPDLLNDLNSRYNSFSNGIA